MFEQDVAVAEHWAVIMLVGLSLIVVIVLFLSYTNYLILKSL